MILENGAIIKDDNAILPAEFDKLPTDIRNKIIINYKPRGLPDNPNFLPAIGNPPSLLKIDKAISAGCVKEPSLYAQSQSAVIDGYTVRIFPKGWHIYKTFLGFVTEEQISAFVKEHPNRPSWCGDQYLTYAIARTNWGTIVSFRLEHELVLLDYFNVANLNRLIAEIEDLKEEFPSGRTARDVLLTIRYATGLGIDPAEHITAIAEIYPTWDSLWYYTMPILPQNTATHCDPRIVEGLNPIGAIKSIHSTDLVIFDVVLSRHPAIDGIVRDGIRSKVDESGVFYHEEYLIKGSSQIAKLRFDKNDPICWTNWVFRDFTPPRDGLRLDYAVAKFSSSNRLAPNNDFTLAKFYMANNTPLYMLPKARALPQQPHILAYNVHGFISLNADIPRSKTHRDIEVLLKRYASVVEFIALTEVSRSGPKLNILLSRAGYTHYISAPNGSHDKSSLIIVASKRPLRDIKIITTDTPSKHIVNGAVRTTHRKQILFTTSEGFCGVALHLDIGERYLNYDPIINEERKANNSAMRIMQLTTILKYNPDFITGDFNFVLEDPECRFLEEHGYVPTNDDHENSTPYNRVDHFFIHRKHLNKLPHKGNRLLHCNYSDHLPMLQVLPKSS